MHTDYRLTEHRKANETEISVVTLGKITEMAQALLCDYEEILKRWEDRNKRLGSPDMDGGHGLPRVPVMEFRLKMEH